MPPFSRWQDAVQALRRSAAPATPEQTKIAEAVGASLDDLPAPVAAVALIEAMADPLRLASSPEPTENEVEYVQGLAGELGREAPSDLSSRARIDAWLEVLYAARAIAALEDLKPEPGDLVVDAETGDTPGIVKSISADGRINFEGGLGAGARPHRVRALARRNDEREEVSAARQEAKNIAARRRSGSLEQTPSAAKMRRLEGWQVKNPVSTADLLQFEEILDSASDERPIQTFLEGHPEMLASLLGGTYGDAVVPRVDLGGKLEPDFLLAEADSAGIHWWLIELESPTAQVLLQDGEFAEKTRHAIAQIESWRRWLTNNLDLARRPPDQDGLGLIDIRPETTRGLVLIGRRAQVLGSNPRCPAEGADAEQHSCPNLRLASAEAPARSNAWLSGAPTVRVRARRASNGWCGVISGRRLRRRCRRLGRGRSKSKSGLGRRFPVRVLASTHRAPRVREKRTLSLEQMSIAKVALPR